MKTILMGFGSVLTAVALIDGLWLFIMMKFFYAPRIGHLLADKPLFLYAIAFYLIYVIGVVFFVVQPGYVGGWGILRIIGSGALFGFVAYATYDLTNQATLRDWPLVVTVVDLVWGAFLTAFVSLIGVTCVRLFS